jgi:DNA polymerase III gamma/tau subunit
LNSIAKASKGSFRDAIKLVEQVGASGGEVDLVLGTLKGAGPEEFLACISNRDVQGGLKLIEQVISSGISPKQFIERIVEELHEQLVESVNQKSGQTVQIVGLISQLEKVYEQTRMAAVAQLPLEIFVISFGETEAKSVSTKPGGETVIPVVTVKLDTKPELPAAAQQVKAESKPVKVAEIALVSDYKADMSLSDLQPKWPEILKWVKNKNNSIEALLRSTTPKNFDGQTLELEVFYAFHKDKLESEKCRLIIEEALSGVFNRSKMKVKLSLGEKKSVSNAPAAKNIENVKGVVDQDIVTAAEAIFGVQAV